MSSFCVVYCEYKKHIKVILEEMVLPVEIAINFMFFILFYEGFRVYSWKRIVQHLRFKCARVLRTGCLLVNISSWKFFLGLLFFSSFVAILSVFRDAEGVIIVREMFRNILEMDVKVLMRSCVSLKYISLSSNQVYTIEFC